MIYVHTSEEGGKKHETVQFLQTIIIIIRNYFATLSYLMYHVSYIVFHGYPPHIAFFIDQLRFSLSFCTAMHILYFYFSYFSWPVFIVSTVFLIKQKITGSNVI